MFHFIDENCSCIIRKHAYVSIYDICMDVKSLNKSIVEIYGVLKLNFYSRNIILLANKQISPEEQFVFF